MNTEEHICHICQQSMPMNTVGAHVRFVHNIKSKDYYDTYMKKSNEGNCPVCGKECKWWSIATGYAATCSRVCGQLNEATRKKIETTNIEKYGGIAPAVNPIIRQKTAQTNLKKYGVKTPYQNNSIKEKGINTTIQKYGVSNVFELDCIKEKSKNTMMERYGVELNILRPEIKTHIRTIKRASKYTDFLNRLAAKHITYLGTESEYVHMDINRNYKCNLCNKIFSEMSTQAYDVQCGCLRNRSKAEHEIHDWLVTLGYTPRQTDSIYDSKGRMEIDVVVETSNIKLGIEFCGLYWHSELFRSPDYHSRKLTAAEANGYRLLQIYEDEWRDSKDLIKSIIRQILGHQTITKLDARKCIITKLDKTPVDFLNANHIQGECRGSASYGLHYNNELVSVIVFGKNRFGDGWECIRFCTKQNHNVRGAFGKLLNQFIKDTNPFEITSYADLRYFTGSVYNSHGFIKEKNNPIGYYYCPKGFQERLNRMKFQKHKLKHFANYSESKSEVEIMHEAGYNRIFDAGQSVYKWKSTIDPNQLE